MTHESSPIALHMLSSRARHRLLQDSSGHPVAEPSFAAGDGLRSTVPLVARYAIAQTQPCGTVQRSIHRAKVVSNHQQFLSAQSTADINNRCVLRNPEHPCRRPSHVDKDLELLVCLVFAFQALLLPRRRPQNGEQCLLGHPKCSQGFVVTIPTSASSKTDSRNKTPAPSIAKTLVTATVAAPAKNPSAPADHAAANTNSSSM